MAKTFYDEDVDVRYGMSVKVYAPIQKICHSHPHAQILRVNDSFPGCAKGLVYLSAPNTLLDTHSIEGAMSRDYRGHCCK
jgi:hypothetical protein